MFLSEAALKGFGEVLVGFSWGGGQVREIFLVFNPAKKPKFCTCITLKAEAG